MLYYRIRAGLGCLQLILMRYNSEVRQKLSETKMQHKTITFRPTRDVKANLPQLSRELGFFSTSQLILAALREYLIKRGVEI